jgi:hypothetical protein
MWIGVMKRIREIDMYGSNEERADIVSHI